MNEHMSIRNQKCPNRECVFFHRAMGGNIVVHSRKERRFKCSACGRTWVMYREEARFGIKKDFAKVRSALADLSTGLSIRCVAKIIHVNPSTIQRWKNKFKFLENK